MKNKYKIVCKYNNEIVHVVGDVGLSTKKMAKDMISILKLVNPSLVYTIELKETP